MKEFQILVSEQPVIEANFDEVRASLNDMLADYKGLVVTEDTLFACKDAQKELAGLRNKIEAFRKDKKAEFSAPIKAFEDKCKELVAEVEKVEAPIKEGIKVFDDKRREAKKEIALAIISEAIEEHGISERFSPELTIADKYLNLTATEKDVRDDVWQRAYALKSKQEVYEQKVSVIKSVVGKYADLGMSLEDYRYQIDMGMETTEILDLIEETAKRIREVQKPVEEVKPIDSTPKTVEPVNEASDKAQRYVVQYQIVGTKEELLSVSAFLKEHGIAYDVLSQKEA